MKRKIFLSFRPDFFRPILYGIKKYEYRKRFCQEATTAYLYLSSPVQEIIGIMELGTPITMEDIIDNFEKDTIVHKRLTISIENKEKFAVPIESFQLFKKPISIDTIKKLEPNFFVPQCYLDITKKEKLYKYIKAQELYDKEFINSHEKIDENNIGCSCREMETFKAFEELDEKYSNNNKYDIVKAGYLLRKNK